MEQLAESICEFDDILNRTVNAIDVSEGKYPSEITEYQIFIISLYKEAEVALNETINSTHVKIGKQKGNARIQNNIDMTTLTNKSFDLDRCAYCKHRFIIPIGMDCDKINIYNQKFEKKHLSKMQIWSNTPLKRRGVKPCAAKTMTQHLACTCLKMSCLSKANVLGCIQCEISCVNAIEQGSDVRPYFDANFKCTCQICRCECCVIYFCHEANKIAKQQQLDNKKTSQALLQLKIDSFLGFTSALANMTRDKLQYVENTNEAMALTAIDLSNSNLLFQNVKLRNTL